MAEGTFEFAVIGAGIVGLASALELTRRFPGERLIVVEKDDIAAHQTGHNSGVIHSGIYYKPGSLKARTCVEGSRQMIEFCREYGIPHEVCGKVVVATDESELAALEELYRRGLANGVTGLRMLSAEEIRELEPHASGVRGLHVPGTGITDFSLVSRKYAEIIRSRGAEIRTGTEVTAIRRDAETVLETGAGEIRAKYVVNCAGLFSDRVSRMAGADTGVRIVPFRGEYYEIAPQKRALVRALIYPVPDVRFPFLGVHFTRRVEGSVEAGPNAVLALAREGYRKWDISARDSAETMGYGGFWRMARKYWKSAVGEYYRSFSKPAFTRALQKLVPEIKQEDLKRGGSGVRAQALDRDGRLVDDFRFAQSEGMVHVCNVPSPAATASLPIGRAIVNMMCERFGLAAVAR